MNYLLKNGSSVLSPIFFCLAPEMVCIFMYRDLSNERGFDQHVRYVVLEKCEVLEKMNFVSQQTFSQKSEVYYKLLSLR